MNQRNQGSLSCDEMTDPRKSYSQPQLRIYGDLRMLTEGGSISTMETAPPTPTAPMLMMLL